MTSNAYLLLGAQKNVHIAEKYGFLFPQDQATKNYDTSVIVNSFIDIAFQGRPRFHHALMSIIMPIEDMWNLIAEKSFIYSRVKIENKQKGLLYHRDWDLYSKG